jgi:hypothetical protein
MKDYSGKPTTPKMMAEGILMSQICVKLEFFGEEDRIAHLTNSQKKLVYAQSVKISKRLAKVLHYQPESFPWSEYVSE